MGDISTDSMNRRKNKFPTHLIDILKSFHSISSDLKRFLHSINSFEEKQYKLLGFIKIKVKNCLLLTDLSINSTFFEKIINNGIYNNNKIKGETWQLIHWIDEKIQLSNIAISYIQLNIERVESKANTSCKKSNIYCNKDLNI